MILSRFPIVRKAERKFSYGLFGDGDASIGVVYSEIVIKAPPKRAKVYNSFSTRDSVLPLRSYSDQSRETDFDIDFFEMIEEPKVIELEVKTESNEDNLST